MVPWMTPRDRCERCFTHSKKLAQSSAPSQCRAPAGAHSSQVVFIVSHISEVSVPRTARAFSRAARRQL